MRLSSTGVDTLVCAVFRVFKRGLTWVAPRRALMLNAPQTIGFMQELAHAKMNRPFWILWSTSLADSWSIKYLDIRRVVQARLTINDKVHTEGFRWCCRIIHDKTNRNFLIDVHYFFYWLASLTAAYIFTKNKHFQNRTTPTHTVCTLSLLNYTLAFAFSY